MSNLFDDDDEHTHGHAPNMAPLDIGAALRQVFPTTVPQPDWGEFWFNVTLNTTIGPLMVWVVFMKTGLLPFSVFGFLSVSFFVVLMRLCVLDTGLARMPYKPAPTPGDSNE